MISSTVTILASDIMLDQWIMGLIFEKAYKKNWSWQIKYMHV